MSLSALPARQGAFSHALLRSIIRSVFVFLLLAAGAQSVFAHEFKLGDLEIKHPWSRATPAGASVAGGYLVIINHGSTPDRLVSITSDIAAKAQVHEMSVTDGVMKMGEVEGGLEIPAGGTVALEPNAYHIMFLNLKTQPKQGEKFPATLTFEKAGKVDVEFAVEAMDATHDHM